MTKEIKLIYKNHDEDSVPVNQNINNATGEIKIEKDDADDYCPCQVWSSYDIVLVHDSNIQSFIRGEIVTITEQPKELSVIIAFGSSGVKHSPKKHNFNKNGSDCKFYSFGIHPPQTEPLNTAEWKKILLFAANLSGNDITIEEVSSSIPNEIKHILCPQSLNHLIALSILCQGYLAAHDIEGFKVPDDELQKKAAKSKITTEIPRWWEPALDDVINKRKEVEKSKIYEELKAGSENIKDYEKITNLVKAIINDEKADFTVKVSKAYENLKEILKT